MVHKYTIKDFLEIKSAEAPDWNHDASVLGYTSNLSGVSQIYLTNFTDHQHQQITFSNDGVSVFAFSPVSNEIIFSRCIGGDENYQLYLYNISTQKTEMLTNKVGVRHNFGGWSFDGKYIAYAANDRNGKDFDIYIMEMSTRDVRRIFEKGGNCMSTGFAPSGEFLGVSRSISNVEQEFFTVSLKDGVVEQILKNDTPRRIYNVKVTSDNSGLYFITDKDREFCGLAFLNFHTRSERYILAPEWDITKISMTRDGKFLGIWVNENGYIKTTIYDRETMLPLSSQHFPKGIIGGTSWTSDGTFLAFTLHTSKENSNIYIWDRIHDTFRAVTSMPQGVPASELVEPTLIQYATFDGMQIPSFIYLPEHPELPSDKRKFPALIFIHGGPGGQFVPTFSPILQYLVYLGFAVVAPNVRGSGGYGKTYLSLDDTYLRMDSVKDIAALHAYLRSRSDIDIEKIMLWGGSYGGFMVLAGLCFYPELWAGGVDIVGISNFITFLEKTAPYRRENREKEYGSLKDDRAFLQSISPINFVHKIKAPLLIIHGANDPRVPLGEAEQIYQELTNRGVASELLVYHDEGHGLSKLNNRIDAYTKATRFLLNLI
jgi:dipeptidyl aminopeptidase/acylaminoacyl peptidase